MDRMNVDYLISIIIIVKNEEHRIGKCIDSLLYQKEIENCEVLFVDGNSSDNTVFIINKYRKKHNNFRVITCDRSGYAYQRNIGIVNSLGKYILFISGDTVCDSNLIRKYIDGINKGYEVIQGTVIQNGEDKVSRVLYKIYHKTMENELEDISTVNIMIKRSLFENNLFDVRTVASEDKLWYLLLENKPHYRRMKGAVVFHTVHESVIQYSRKIQKEAIGIGASLVLHSNLWMSYNFFGWLNMTICQCITLLIFLVTLFHFLFISENYLILGVGIATGILFELYKFFSYRMYEDNWRSIMILELFIFSAQKGLIQGVVHSLLMRKR